jgi:hypothetical protein
MDQNMLKTRAALLLAFFVLCGFTKQSDNGFGQPASERKAQDALPKSADPLWKILGKTKIHLNEKKGLYSATYPPEVKALVGKQVTLKGLMLPLEPTEKFHHFLISLRTPTCPFCPPGEPNEIADVVTDKAVKWDEDMIKVTGTFGLMDNPELGLFFKISNAKAL